VKPEDKMATNTQNGDIITLSFPIFSLTMMRVGAEDLELGQSIGLLAASWWHGTLNRARFSDSCDILVGVLTAVLWMVLERLISLEVQL
jgi:hypothetical protein